MKENARFLFCEKDAEIVKRCQFLETNDFSDHIRPVSWLTLSSGETYGDDLLYRYSYVFLHIAFYLHVFNICITRNEKKLRVNYVPWEIISMTSQWCTIRFSVDEMSSCYLSNLYHGLPQPLMYVAEFFTVDAGGLRWIRVMREAGHFTYIILW